MGVQVTFDYTTWSDIFAAQFSNLNQAQVEGTALPIAEQYCRNDGGGPVTTAAMQTNLLNLMVAHICQLLFGINGQPPSPLVGRIVSAGEGTVSVNVDFPMTPSNAWFEQTQFGSMFYQLCAAYRTMRYVAPQRRLFSPWLNQ